MSDALDQLAKAAQASRAPRIEIPDYRKILLYAKSLRAWGSLCRFWALLSLAGGLFWAVVFVTNQEHTPVGYLSAALWATVFIISGISAFVTWWIIGTVLRLFAEVSLAHRDMAQNSYRAAYR